MSFIVMEPVEGTSLTSEAAAGTLSPEDRLRIGHHIIAILARVHQLEPGQLAMPSPQRPFLERQLDVLLRSWIRFGTSSPDDLAWRAVLTCSR